MLEAYMIFGGVPYYWSLLQKGTSITAKIDRLVFSPDGELHDEFEMLYASLFKKPEPYARVIELLAKKKMGMTRQELLTAGRFEDNGALSDILKDMEARSFHSHLRHLCAPLLSPIRKLVRSTVPLGTPPRALRHMTICP